MKLQPIARDPAAPRRAAARTPDHERKRGTAGFKAMLRIQAEWGLANPQVWTLLGISERTLYRWKAEVDAGRLIDVPRDTLERISYVLGVWKDLQILFPGEANRRHWLDAPNRSPTFAGRSPKQRMLAGNVGDLYAVRRYLDGWRG